MACCRRSRTYLSRWFYYLLLAVGIVLSCLAVASCRFVDVRDPEAFGSTIQTTGLFRHYNDETDTCEIIYENESLHGVEHGARLGGVVAPMLGALAFILMAMESCCVRSRCCCQRLGRWMAQFSLFMAVIFQGLTFLWIGSADCGGDWHKEISLSSGGGGGGGGGEDQERQCTNHVAEGAACSVAALLVYVLCTILILCIPAPYQKTSKSKEDLSTDGESTDEDEKNQVV